MPDSQYIQFKVALKNWIESLRNQIKSIDENAYPALSAMLKENLQDTEAMYFDLTGVKAPEFKKLLDEKR